MELPSPVASLIPRSRAQGNGDVWEPQFDSQRSRLGEYPFCATRAAGCSPKRRRNGAKAEARRKAEQCSDAGDAAQCCGHRYRGDGDFCCRSWGSSSRECVLLSHLHTRPVSIGRLAQGVRDQNRGDGVNRGVLDSTVPDSGGAWLRGVSSQRPCTSRTFQGSGFSSCIRWDC